MPRVLLDLLDPDADIQHAVNLELLRRFHRDEIEFGYSTRTLQLRSDESTSSSSDSSA